MTIRKIKRNRHVLGVNKAPQFYSSFAGYSDNEEEDYSGMGEGTDQSAIKTVSWTDSFGAGLAKVAQTAVDVLPAIAAYKTQSNLVKLNIVRAKQGLAPVDTGAQVKIGISDDVKTFAYIGLGAIALILILPKLMKR